MANLVTVSAVCTCSSHKSVSGTFKLDELRFFFFDSRVCLSCTVRKLREQYEICKSLGVISCPEPSERISIDWEKLNSLKGDKITVNAVLCVLKALRILSQRKTNHFGISGIRLVFHCEDGSLANLYFKDEIDARSFARAFGKKVLIYQIKTGRSRQNKGLSACG